MTFTSLGANNPHQGAARALLWISPHVPRGGEELSPRGNPSSKGEEYSTPAAPRILIVEDVLLVAWHLESLVLELGYEVCGLATDGQDAIEQAADVAANVLLMDVNLGEGMDGIEAARRIRETAPAAIVFVTAYNVSPYTERIEQAFPGAPLLAKPVTRDSLRAAIVAARKLESG
jgi:CheY-like chemotaxis protein